MPIAWEKNIDLVEDNMTEMGWPYLPQFNYHVRSKKIALYVQGKLNVVYRQFWTTEVCQFTIRLAAKLLS
jgi:hypothetical protein